MFFLLSLLSLIFSTDTFLRSETTRVTKLWIKTVEMLDKVESELKEKGEYLFRKSDDYSSRNSVEMFRFLDPISLIPLYKALSSVELGFVDVEADVKIAWMKLKYYQKREPEKILTYNALLRSLKACRRVLEKTRARLNQINQFNRERVMPTPRRTSARRHYSRAYPQES